MQKLLQAAIVAAILILFSSTNLFSQNNNVGIGTTTPEASAKLDVESTTQGFLPPRMTNAERDAIASPAQGLMIYCTNCGTDGEPQFYNGTTWVNMVGAAVTSGPPILTTTAITSITADGAASGGNITSDDGDAVTARGVCLSLNPNPTTASALTTDGTGTGSYSSALTGLFPGSTYYVRAYATNSAGTSYGNELSFTTPALAIGDAFQGGIVFYLDGNGGGLIAAPSDQSAGIIWGSTGATVGTSTAVGTGQANTTAIVALYGAATAAGVCDNLTIGTYSDWFLPSLDELNLLYAQRIAVGGFGTGIYWCSTERNASNIVGFWGGWTQRFSDGAQFGAPRGNTYPVRAIRSFDGPTAQERLDAGATPKQLFDDGVPLNSIIGRSYEGGLIGIFNTNTGTGIVIAPFDQAAGAAGTRWSINYNSIVTGTNGQINTANIVADQGAGNYAAYLCDTLTLNGKTDWYLPSLGELQSMNPYYTLIGMSSWYWSSEQSDIQRARVYNMGANPVSNIFGKLTNHNYIKVRAVRAF